MVSDGYTGTALAQRLDLKRGVRAWFSGMPGNIRADLDLEGLGVDEQETASAGLEHVHLFCTDRAELERQLGAINALIDPAAFVWVSWRHAGQSGDALDAAAIREAAEPLGLVALKECPVDGEWSAIKLMMKQSLR